MHLSKFCQLSQTRILRGKNMLKWRHPFHAMILMRDLWEFRRMINNKIKIIINRINLHYKIEKSIASGLINKTLKVRECLKFQGNNSCLKLKDKIKGTIQIEKTWKIGIRSTIIRLVFKNIWMAYLFQNKFLIINKLTNCKDIIIKNKIINTLNLHKKWVSNHTITQTKEPNSSSSTLSRDWSHHPILNRILLSLHIKDSHKVFPQLHLQDMSKDKLSISSLTHLNSHSMFFSNLSLLYTKGSDHLTLTQMFKQAFQAL